MPVLHLCLTSLPCPLLQAHCVVLQLPQRLCVSRAAARVGHEGGVKPEQAQAVVGRMTAQMRPPSPSEGVSSIMVRIAAVSAWIALPWGSYDLVNTASPVQSRFFMRWLG